MTDVEVALANLGEIATRELAKRHKPYGLKENKEIAKKGGHVAKVAREDMEKELGQSVVSKENTLNYKYLDDNKTLKAKSKKELKEKIFFKKCNISPKFWTYISVSPIFLLKIPHFENRKCS